MPQKTLYMTLLTLQKYIFILSYIYHFLLLFFTINNVHIQMCLLKSLRLTVLFHLLFQRLESSCIS